MCSCCCIYFDEVLKNERLKLLLTINACRLAQSHKNYLLYNENFQKIFIPTNLLSLSLLSFCCKQTINTISTNNIKYHIYVTGRKYGSFFFLYSFCVLLRIFKRWDFERVIRGSILDFLFCLFMENKYLSFDELAS